MARGNEVGVPPVDLFSGLTCNPLSVSAPPVILVAGKICGAGFLRCAFLREHSRRIAAVAGFAGSRFALCFAYVPHATDLAIS